MSDLDQQLRDLLHERAATVGPPPPLPPALRGDSPRPWLRRRPEWLLVPAVAVVTAAAVIAVAVISSENGPGTVMPAEQAESWAQEVCTNRPSAQSPSQDQVRGMAIAASAICWWENPANLGDETVGLQHTTALSAGQIEDLQALLVDAPEESPTCAMFDSPPQVEYYVYLHDADGQAWRIDIAEPACLGFDLKGAQVSSPVLVDWLREVSTDGFAEFRSDVLTCPEQQPLPGNRLPTCEVAPDRLLNYGQAACHWLQGQPVAVEWRGDYDYWNDPYYIETVAHTFASETINDESVPRALERPERALVASIAWRTLCPEFDDRYNTPPADAVD